MSLGDQIGDAIDAVIENLREWWVEYAVVLLVIWTLIDALRHMPVLR